MKNKIISKITSGILLFTMTAYTAPVFAYTKEEMVYSKLDNSGKSYNTVVSSHLKNDDGEKVLNDLSDLIDIENIGGDNELTQNGNSLIWNADKNDIYYQGESQKDLPVECKISYELDGNLISASELAGKSGKVKITIQYVNKDKHQVKVNGKYENLYTPFIVVSGVIIDNENNKNIQVTNGKVIDNGNKTAVMGMSMPGLQESLNIKKSEIDIPDTVEITMETTKFELGNIITFVTPKIIENSDLEIFDKLDGIYSKVETLKNSAKQIEEGANSLKEGTNTYNEKSQEFNSAMNKVAKGVNSASSKYKEIDTGINTLSEKSEVLSEGAKSISTGSQTIAEKLNIVIEKLGELGTGVKGLETGEDKLLSGLELISSNLGTVNVSDNSAKIAQLTALKAQNELTVKNLKTANQTLTASLSAEAEETKTSVEAQIATNKSLIALLEENNKALTETINTLKLTDMTAIEELKTGISNLKTGILELKAGTQKIYNGENELKQGIELLEEKIKELVAGAGELYKGTAMISEGANKLNSGSAEMKKGLNTLDYSTEKLNVANNQLVEGAGTISEGATTLAEGISKFNKEGIEKICNYINGDLKDVTARMEKLQELSEEYNNFTMLNNGAKGNVKFIFVTDSIKLNENKENEEFILTDSKFIEKSADQKKENKTEE